MAGLGNDAHTREERSQDSQTNVSAYQWTKTLSRDPLTSSGAHTREASHTVLVVFTER
jgi:hypothetical protein